MENVFIAQVTLNQNKRLPKFRHGQMKTFEIGAIRTSPSPYA
ncbi:hypothetical protein HanXRQr2_Chr06g0276471 [Helianthus annuus]|uniref:Uncharacterized protein n=1 Tax=Helianthus annuus TaxID=4232 RepID=A0A9K3NLM6_HELAN|nr:hypothetical protein HanXRQr2_Chr06g0276471 [Helianthus annuus]KAJ0916920.1 hypothetical protein HanPSC8_Chr06g0267331 [Helianthus annuus]